MKTVRFTRSKACLPGLVYFLDPPYDDSTIPEQVAALEAYGILLQHLPTPHYISLNNWTLSPEVIGAIPSFNPSRAVLLGRNMRPKKGGGKIGSDGRLCKLLGKALPRDVDLVINPAIGAYNTAAIIIGRNPQALWHRGEACLMTNDFGYSLAVGREIMLMREYGPEEAHAAQLSQELIAHINKVLKRIYTV